MRYTVGYNSDKGKHRMVNQDAIGIKHLEKDGVEIVFAILCDGMGGFKEGELASTSVVKGFMNWFDEKFCANTYKYSSNVIYRDWISLIDRLNAKIHIYGKLNGITIGTTVTAMLLLNENYYILNVGDSRAYELQENIRQITIDHTVVAEEILNGNITHEEARHDERRNQLLKSIGVLKKVTPDFFYGKLKKDSVYMLCCDGVRNKVYDEELLYYFHPSIMINKNNIKNNIKYIFDLNTSRGETDNMSVVLIKTNTCTSENNEQICKNLIYDEKIITNSEKYISIELEANSDYI